MKTTRINRHLAMFVATIMALTLWAGFPLGASAASEGTTIDLADDSVANGASGTGWSYNNNVYTITDGAEVTISGTTTTKRVEIAESAEVTITLNGVNITGPDVADQAPISVRSGANATIILSGENTLTAKNTNAGLRVESNASLTIEGDGKLTAKGGGTTGSHGGAGIGGMGVNSAEALNTGTITIQGDVEVVANGGVRAAGIGGGGFMNNRKNYSGEIIIKGGTVTATTVSFGAGIGGGADSINKGSVSIDSGMVTVTGGTNGVGIGSGHNSADNGNISIKNAIIFANSISNTATYENAVTVIGSTTTFYDASGSTTGTNTVTLTGEYTILAGKTLTIPAGKTLTVTAGATLNVSGTLTVDANANFLVEPGALVSGTGTITGAPISNLAYSSITNTSITIHKPTLSQATGQTIEYAISTTNLPPNNGWQDVPATEDLITISSLDPNKTYYIFARSKAQVPYQTGIAKFLQVTTLYPVTVTFNSQGGSAISPDTQDKLSGETVDTVDSPTKTGYTFSYWYYKDNEQNEHPFTLASTLLTEANGVKITDNVGAIALYAKWSAKPVTITYQTDGTLAAGGTTTGTLGEQIGALATTSKTGYGFVWKNSDTVYSTETVLSEAAGVVLTGGEGNNTLTLTADWTAGPVAISYDLNAGTDETAGLTNTPSDAGTYNSAIETFPTAKRTGYTLEGWYADSSVIDNQYGASTKINVGVTGDGSAGYKLELYAKWTAKPVTITYYRNDGTEAIYDGGEAASGTYDEKIAAAPTAPIRAGYTFGGWFKDEVAKNAWIFGDEGTALNADNGVVDADEAEPTLSLYAKWTANPPQTYAVTVNNGTGGGSFAAGDKVSITADALSGKIFDSWTGSVDFVNAGSPATSFVMPANAVTVTATYKDASVVVPPGSQVEEEGESIKVTLPDGGGSVVVPPGSTVTPGENEGEIEVTLPGEDAPVIVPPGSTVMPGENEGEIEVILPGDGGSVIVPPGSTVDAEGNVTVPPDNPPATENGWVKNEDGEWKYLVGGVAKTGWLYDTNYKAWFYLGTNGAMLTGWVYDRNDKAWYYLASNGKMVAGKWLHDTDGSWYYLSGNGKMLTGKQNIGGKTYSFRGNGVWIG